MSGFKKSHPFFNAIVRRHRYGITIAKHDCPRAPNFKVVRTLEGVSGRDKKTPIFAKAGSRHTLRHNFEEGGRRGGNSNYGTSPLINNKRALSNMAVFLSRHGPHVPDAMVRARNGNAQTWDAIWEGGEVSDGVGCDQFR